MINTKSEDIFENYDVFYDMTLAHAVMTNTYSTEAVADSERVLDFIATAYGMNEGFTKKAKDIILKKLVNISVLQDIEAYDATKSYDNEYTELDKYREVKYDIISMLLSERKSYPDMNYGWTNYEHYNVYQANARYRKLAQSATKGDMISIREAAIFRALGIGCKPDLEDAARKLLQCALWSDVQSTYLLSYVCKLLGKNEKAKMFSELATLTEEYLDDGITVLPDEVKKSFSEEACMHYVYISSIKYDVIYAYNLKRIDFSFLEVMMSDKISHNDKMKYINEYNKKEWKNCTNSITEKQKRCKIGF